MRDRFAKDYEVVMIDTDRMTGGAELAAELRKGKRGGIPWMITLDGDGHPKATSDGPKGNIGCPVKPHEIDHFLQMIKTAPGHMSKEDRIVVARELRAHGARLSNRSSRPAGLKPFAKATKAVRFGQLEAAVPHLIEALEDGYPPESILTNPALRPLREDPDRRMQLSEMSKEHVKTNTITLIERRRKLYRFR